MKIQYGVLLTSPEGSIHPRNALIDGKLFDKIEDAESVQKMMLERFPVGNKDGLVYEIVTAIPRK